MVYATGSSIAELYTAHRVFKLLPKHLLFRFWLGSPHGATTLSIMTINITTVSMMTVSISTVSVAIKI